MDALCWQSSDLSDFSRNKMTSSPSRALSWSAGPFDAVAHAVHCLLQEAGRMMLCLRGRQEKNMIFPLVAASRGQVARHSSSEKPLAELILLCIV
jgi:hypothetical protein